MNHFNSLLIAITLCVSSTNALARNSYHTAFNTVFVLADSSTAAMLSVQQDEYTKAHTPFDLAIRLDKETGATEEDYLNASAKNVGNWQTVEEAQIKVALNDIATYLKTQNATLHLPDTIVFIKTTAKEEFGAEGWTRRNRIMLNTAAQAISTHLVAHELFHVLSRHDKKLRDAVYQVFKFKPCNDIAYKAAMHNKVITNPDCPFLQHYITVTIDGQKQDVALMLYSKNDYHKGYGMDQYANIGLLALTGDDTHKTPLLKDGEPIVYDLMQAPNLFEQIGMNTQYILHVEEISAEHFATLLSGETMPQKEFLDGVARALTLK